MELSVVETVQQMACDMKLFACNRKPNQAAVRVATALASLTALVAASDLSLAAKLRTDQSVAVRPGGEPIMAIVSLHDQQITVYDDKGLIMRAPVSSGQKGRETPAGIFSVLSKNAEHYSNLYDDAFMPHMQRLTWSGIALHGGPLPGYPASHGCIRLPYSFAERLFGTTKVGMRVIVAPSGVGPVSIEHPALFQPKTENAAIVVAAAAAKAEETAAKADQARLAAVTANRESTLAIATVRKTEALKTRAEAELAAAERAIASASSPEAKERAESAKQKVTARITELEAQLAAAKTDLQPKADAVTATRDAAVAADRERVAAADAARKAKRELEPVSVFISRKNQRLYVRQGFQPILEVPVTFKDADRPIGTYVFTAMDRSGPHVRWSMVALVSEKDAGPSEVDRAKSALDRITIPQESIDLITEKVSPRSALIISDEPLSQETGSSTEFIVTLSGEPQGGLKQRRRSSPTYEVRYDRPRSWRSPFAGQYSNHWFRF
jgi:L,D-transpeptidase catalytic domain